ncbi:hypothetical protein [Streptomyces sp. NPDC012510]|uniref:hypothetical protein n=1 Tax=Streptomyces sp. NPDC012510 TaxID=3364838 RepID=UPI0036EC5BDD
MRRTARVLSATALIGAVLGAAAPAAYAEPAPDVSPLTPAPGGTLTISVACDPTGGPAPETIDAGSDAFEQGTVTLQRVPGDDSAGPSYQGTAKIAPAADFDIASDAKGASSEWGVDGTCPAPAGGEEKQWSTTFDVSLGGDQHPTTDPPSDPQPYPSADQELHSPTEKESYPPTETESHQPSGKGSYQPTDKEPYPPGDPQSYQPTHHATQHTAPVQRGVHAGDGGAFTDSVPALVAGGLLIAGALGAAVHRLRHRDRWMS